MSGKKKIFIVDDHPLYREGLTQFINREKELVVCGTAESAEDALEKIEKEKPDMVLVDMSLKGSSGLDLIKSLHAQDDSLPMLMLSMHDEALYCERVIQAGARGYVMKQEATEKVMKAIHKIFEGKIYVSENMTEKMLEKKAMGVPDNEPSITLLSDRELEVYRLIGEGTTTAEIAKNLHLSVKTIETYRANIKTKLNLKNNTELIKHAVEWVQCDKESL